jgi:hypothetical protein
MIGPVVRKRAAVMRSLVARFHPDDAEEVLSHFSGQEQAAMREVEVAPFKIKALATSVADSLSFFHDSWIEQALSQEPPTRRPLYKKALEGKLPPAAGAFLLGNLLNLTGFQAVVPLDCLGKMPLSWLLGLDKRVLVRMIGYLGLRDLGAEMKRTIESAKLRETEALLADRQTSYLRHCMQESDPMPGPRHTLEEWIAESGKLAQESGLIRLGRALSSHDRSFIWHLAHRLDTGRGRWIMTHAQETIAPAMTNKLVAQVADAAQFLHVGGAV